MIATTTETIDGYRINEYLGLVAISKDPRGFFTGVNVDKLIDMLKNEASEKYDADAVIGIRFFQYEGNASGDIMVYGTAVKIEEEQ